jgi:hypothetical protein
MSEQLSLSEAIRLSLIKWEWKIKNPLKTHELLYKKYPEISFLIHSCGFCERYRCWCGKCELYKIIGACNKSDTVYDKYCSAVRLGNYSEAKQYATKIRDAILQIKKENNL